METRMGAVVKVEGNTDVLVVGAGPIGIELAVALKRTGIEYLHVEAGALGATIAWYAPGTAFFSSPERLSIAGVPFETYPHYKATREEYLHYLRAVVKQFELPIRTYSRLAAVSRLPNGDFGCEIRRSLHGVGGPQEGRRNDPSGTESIRASRIVLAVGDMHRPRMLDVPGETLPHVSHFLSEPHIYAGCRVLVVGGANSAAEAAIRLYRAGARVTLAYRGENLDPTRIKPWVLPELRGLIREGKVSFLSPVEVSSIDEATVRLTKADTVTEVPADFVLLLTGYVQDGRLFESLGIELCGDEKHPQHDLNTMETNVPGVFVIGTAVAGSQTRAKHFIETSHIHINRVLRAFGVTDYPDHSENLRPVEDREL